MAQTAFRAEEYDEKIRQTLPFYEAFYEQVIDVLDISGKKSVSWLDVGCGTGKMVGGMFFTFENIAPDSEIGRRLALDRWKFSALRSAARRKRSIS